MRRLLFLTTDEVRQATAQIVAAQPFLGALAADPSLRGIMGSLSTALLGVNHGQVTLDRMSAPISEFARSLEDFFAGKPTFLSWRKLAMGGGEP